MALDPVPAVVAGAKTRYVVTLFTGTSWTVPAGCTYVNATLIGGGGGGGAGLAANSNGIDGQPGQTVETNVATTPGASITYAIGACGVGGVNAVSNATQGGTTTFTGATSAVGGKNGSNAGDNSAGNGVGTAGGGLDNGGKGGVLNGSGSGSAGGAGKIELEYWV